MGFPGVINVILRKQIGMSRSFSLFHPSSTQQLEEFKNSSYYYLFQKKNWKKNVTLDPRHGTLALDMELSTLDPRQKDRLVEHRR